MSHLHTDSNFLVLLHTEACDPSWQHPSIRSDKLTQQQDILREQEKGKIISARATLTAVILRCCADPRAVYRTQNKTMIPSYAFWLQLDNKWLLLAVTLPASLAQ